MTFYEKVAQMYKKENDLMVQKPKNKEVSLQIDVLSNSEIAA